ncbi:MAG: bifunctional UDP-sugar hydrolase/5'-nucleotidase [Bacteroidota bacterium]
MRKSKYLLLSSFLFFFFIHGFSQNRKDGKVTEIIILHTNDMHAKIDNMGKLAYLADSLRRFHPYVFLLAAGDNFTGNPVVDMVEDKGYPMIDLMNQCGFNASALGNHEFDLGQEFLNRRVEQAKFPFLCANIQVTGGALKQPVPSTLLKAGNTTIDVVSFIELNENGFPDSHPSKLKGLSFSNGLVKAKEFSGLKSQYDVVVALTHLGVDDDKELAKQCQGFDMIIGGHSHTIIDTTLLVNGVLITQAGCYLKFIGKTTILLKDHKIISKKDELIPIGVLTRSKPEVQVLINKYNDNDEFKKVIATADQAIDGFDNLGSLYTDALRDHFKTDFAFQNRKGLRIYSIPQGDITLKALYQLDPFQNQVVTYTLTADEMSSLICNAFNKEKNIDLAVSGMNYTVTTDATGRCIAVEMQDPTGLPLNTTSTYTVAMNDYISSAYTFNHKSQAISSGITTEQVLIEYLQKIKTVHYSGIERTFLKGK